MLVVFKLALVSLVVTVLLLVFLSDSWPGPRRPLQHLGNAQKKWHHPIDGLIENASLEHELLLGKQTHGLHTAAAAYRARRSRHPPPQFDRWVEYASSKGALIIEDLFDRIYDDLRPFWAVDPTAIASFAADWEFRISIRNGTASLPEGLDHAWMNLWFEMIKEIEGYLPDIDLAFNHMDESRLLVPWEEISRMVNEANNQLQDTLNVIKSDDILSSYQSLGPPSNTTKPSDDFTGSPPLWKYARKACPPQSPGNEAPVDTDFSGSPTIPSGWPAYSHQGYVRNWTLAKSLCIHPHLRNLHGAFIEPVSLSVSTKLLPLFGGSKISGLNNEILLPAPAYWSDSPFYSGGGPESHISWEQKTDKLIWRGAASGGRNTVTNWRHFHRHRFVAALNGTQVGYELAKQSKLGPLLNSLRPGNSSASNFAVPDSSAYALRANWRPGIGGWLKSFADVAFVHLECFPRTGDRQCDYTAPFFSVQEHLPMAQQYSAKYLPDIDGNSYSGRYPAFLRSNSLPIKSTVFDEWHDSRVLAWKHFVPMDGTYKDVYGLMDYFIGSGGSDSRDEVAHMIAGEGKAWADRVLRREDMLVYVYRLVLEYARLTHAERNRMGYVGDLDG